MKKILAVIVALAVSATLFMGVSMAATTNTGTVTLTSGNLNVRAAASATATIIGTLANGSQVTLISSTNGFYQINFSGKTGYVSAKYVVNNQAKTVVATAKTTIGVKYVFGGATMSGFDCSGLVVYCYAKVGMTLPHQSGLQSKLGTFVNRADLKLGDLVFFDTNGGNDAINHVGIYVGNGMVIQAQSGLGKVAQISLTNSFWSRSYMTARRVLV